MSELNTIDAHRLSKLISDLQLSIFMAGGSGAETTNKLVRALADAQNQLVDVEYREDIERRELEQKHEQQLAIAVVAAAEREAALSHEEKQEFSMFLKCEYFTKSMFGQLEHFYTHSWDRLSDDGKAEMSQRVWNGMRHGEYRFSELPEPVKEKEAQRVELGFKHPEKATGQLFAIPETDRTDFMNARADGRLLESYSILDRPSFARHIAVSDAKNMVDGMRADSPKAKDAETEAAKTPPSTKADDAAQKSGSIKLNLQKLQLVDADEAQQGPPLTGHTGNSTASDPALSPRR